MDEEFVSNLTKRGEPSRGEWRDPSDFEGSLAGRQIQLVTTEVRDAYQNRDNPGPFTPQIVRFPVNPPDAVTSHYILFQGKVTSLAIQGLWGCTAIVVVSERGAWASHIWEKSFDNLETYRRDVLESLTSNFEQDMLYHLLPLSQTIANVNIGDQGVMFGDKAKGAVEVGTRVYVMAPYSRPWPRFDVTWHPYFTDLQLESNNFNPRPDKDLYYGDLIDRLKDDIRSILGDDVPIETIPYAPMVLNNALEEQRQKGLMPVDEHINILGDIGQTTARGKALIQYHPAKTCRGWAEWRAWFEGGPLNGRRDKWGPATSQLLVREGNQKREECPLDNPDRDDPTSSETSASETSTETSASETSTETSASETTTETSTSETSSETSATETSTETSTTPPTPTTTDPAETCASVVPTLMAGEGNNEDCRCYYNARDAETSITKFPRSEQDKVIEAMCQYTPVDPNHSEARFYTLSDYGIELTYRVSRVRTTVNQDGCKDEAIIESDQWKEYCTKALNTVASCDVVGNGESLGGKYIDNSDYGCIRWEFYAFKSTTG